MVNILCNSIYMENVLKYVVSFHTCGNVLPMILWTTKKEDAFASENAMSQTIFQHSKV